MKGNGKFVITHQFEPQSPCILHICCATLPLRNGEVRMEGKNRRHVYSFVHACVCMCVYVGGQRWWCSYQSWDWSRSKSGANRCSRPNSSTPDHRLRLCHEPIPAVCRWPVGVTFLKLESTVKSRPKTFHFRRAGSMSAGCFGWGK